MKKIKDIIEQPYAPESPNVMWLDTSDKDNPILKGSINGSWKPISSSGGGSGSADAVKYTEQQLTEAQQEQARKNINATSTAMNTTWSELKDLRDNGGLTPGSYYRITDYVAVTTQPDTRSANHPFDIVVLALDENTLSEDAYATQHEGDTYFKDCNIAAWKLKYCLDNNGDKFYWVRDTVIGTNAIQVDGDTIPRAKDTQDDFKEEGQWYYYWTDYNGLSYYTTSETPSVGDSVYNLVYDEQEDDDILTVVGEVEAYIQPSVVPSGAKGVIYYMKDEWNNECPYDFKNIQFKRWKIVGDVDGSLDNKYLGIVYEESEEHECTIPYIFAEDPNDFNWFYTFTGQYGDIIYDASTIHYKLSDETRAAAIQDDDLSSDTDSVTDNYIGPTHVSQEKVYNENGYELNNIVFFGLFFDDGFDDGYDTVSIQNNTIENDCTNITFDYNCHINYIGKFSHNVLFGEASAFNVLGTFCSQSIIHGLKNIVGIYYNGYIFGRENTVGNSCRTFIENSSTNTIGNKCDMIKLYDSSNYNIIEDNCSDIRFEKSCWYNTIHNRAYNIAFKENCQYNVVDSDAHNCEFGNYCWYNTIESNNNNVKFDNATSASRCQYITILCGAHPGYDVLKPTSVDMDNPCVVGATYKQVVGLTSSGTLKHWNPADLVS